MFFSVTLSMNMMLSCAYLVALASLRALVVGIAPLVGERDRAVFDLVPVQRHGSPSGREF
jgi:hypothetical protein